MGQMYLKAMKDFISEKINLNKIYSQRKLTQV